MTQYDLILLGAGHAHLGVLRRWAMFERPQGRIALVSVGHHAWYSGMLPGLISGQHAADDCRVELASLCRGAKVELIVDQVAALQADTRQVQLASGACLQGKWLSLNVGGALSQPTQSGTAIECLAVKPFESFLQGWQRWKDDPAPTAIIGGGAAGVELALAMARHVPHLALFCSGRLLSGHNAGLHLRALGHLRQRRVNVREYCPISHIENDQLFSEQQAVWQGARVLLASGATALPWLAQSGLECDARGFVNIAPTLQSFSHPHVFAVGDCSALPGAMRSGVYAVRQGPVLANNLAAVLHGTPLRRYRPQRQSLALLATGDGGALLGWRNWSAGGQIFGRWKDYLDYGFIRRHQWQG
ncbi:FAD-dependent oxidoreductase [Pseudomonas sp.]|uniref:FAD-dependent oxidoreductase n=1 Tax=Pseudomonas sp. TaxID=306 RepID=UPI002580299C|nr:FAD-dependent oxidoreductase [Pseudomonas sp.]